ncbi:MAG: hypothetical protein IKA80_06020 [Spirochaetaceae bacterium]|nr:hypothetical protein [Spirochaetaceae bacterium]
MSRQTHSVKWILLVLFLSIALPWGLWCQERVLSPVEWTVLPKEVYVGDQVELRCVIAPGFELLPGDVDFVTRSFLADEIWGVQDVGSRQKLTARQEEFPLTVHSISLQRVDQGYSVSLMLTPWQPGEIEPGYLEVTALPEVRGFLEKIRGPVLVQLPKIPIASLADKTDARQLRPVAPPVLVPGSIYVVYGLAVVALVLLVGLVVLLARFQQVRLFFKGLASRIRLSRNYRIAVRQLKRLRGQPLDHRELAARLASIARTYLEGRFARPFTAAATSEIMLLLDEIFVGMLSDQQLELVERLVVVLRRCDYLRYAPAAVMLEGEKERLIQSMEEFIGCMEGKQC